MYTGSCMGQSLNHIEVLERMLLPCVGNQRSVQCVGAVVLWFDDMAVFLRSALRYGKQGRGGFLYQQSVEPAITMCSHEEAQWLMQAIGVGWQRLPTACVICWRICASTDYTRSPCHQNVPGDDFDASHTPA